MSGCNCSSCGCAHEKGEVMYMYRNKKGKNVFTGFVQSGKGDKIIWIGKDEKSMRPIRTQEDYAFFMNEMKQYDR